MATVDDVYALAQEFQKETRERLDKIIDRTDHPKGGGSGGGLSGGGGGGAGGKPAKSSFDQINDALEGVARHGAKVQNAMYALANTFDAVLGSLGGGMAKFVEQANPAVVIRFTLAAQNAMSALGRALAPALEPMAAVMQAVGDAVESLNEQSKGFIGSMTAGAGLAGAIGALAGAIGAVVAALAGTATVVAGIVGAVAGLVVTGPNAAKAMAAVGDVLQTMGGLFQQFVAAAMPLVTACIDPLTASFQALKPVLDTTVAFAVKLAGTWTQVLTPMLAVVPATTKLFASLANVFATVMSVTGDLMAVVGGVVSPVLERFVPILVEFADALVFVMEKAVAAINWARRKVGLDDMRAPAGAAFDPRARHAEAVRPMSIGDLRGAANRAYAGVYNSTGKSAEAERLELERRTAAGVESLVGLVGRAADALRGRGAADGPAGLFARMAAVLE